MPSVSFSVDYVQTAHTSDPGQISFDGSAFSATVPASGRLDSVGDMVISPIMGPVLTPDPYNVTIEVTRTSSSTMQFVVIFEAATGGGYYYVPCERIEKTIEDVPITF